MLWTTVEVLVRVKLEVGVLERVGLKLMVAVELGVGDLDRVAEGLHDMVGVELGLEVEEGLPQLPPLFTTKLLNVAAPGLLAQVLTAIPTR